MSLSLEEIEKIALLARLVVSDNEKEHLARDLDSILDYVGKLNSVDTAAIEPTAQVTGLENVFRDDVWVDPASRFQKSLQNPENLMDQVPEAERDFVKVKSILKHK